MTTSRLARPFATLCVAAATIAATLAAAPALAVDLSRVEKARRPTPPATDPALQLVSASASGTVGDGTVCAVSADGSQVAFTSRSAGLVAGDANGEIDLFVKNLNGNGVTRVVASAAPLQAVFCLAMTPDAGNVVFTRLNPSVLPAILVKHMATGLVTEVTPPVSSLATVAGFQFAGISDDGSRVAFIAQPTRTCALYSCTALGPARLLVRDLPSGALLNLEAQVRFTTGQGAALGDARLSPDGSTLVFSTSAPYPELGDTNARNDVFAFDIDDGTLQQVNTSSAGTPITLLSATANPVYGVQGFLDGGSRVVLRLPFDSSAGAAGLFAKDLAGGGLTRLFGLGLASISGYTERLSFSDDGRRVAYIASSGNTATGSRVPQVLDLDTGAVLRGDMLSSGTTGNGNTSVSALLSRDGTALAFDSNATNLVRGTGSNVLRAYRRLLP